MAKLVHFIILAMFWISGEFIKNELPASTLEFYKTIHDSCEQQINVKDLDKHIQEFNSGQNINNKDFKCYIKCMLVEMNVYNEKTGQLNFTSLEILESKSYSDSIKVPVQNCFDKFKDVSEVCERIYKSYKCLYDFDPENMIVV